jgi:hypothetical protein
MNTTILTEELLTEFDKRLNSCTILEFGRKLDLIKLRSLHFNRIVKLVLILRDEARFLVPEDQLYAFYVSFRLKNEFYILICRAMGPHQWTSLWEMVAHDEKNRPTDKHSKVADSLNKIGEDTSKTGRTSDGDIIQL